MPVASWRATRTASWWRAHEAHGFGWLLSGVVLNSFAQLGLKMATRHDRRHRRHAARPVARGPAARDECAFWLAFTLRRVGQRCGSSGCRAFRSVRRIRSCPLGYIIAALLAWIVLGEAVGLARWAGIGLIIAGVLLVSRSHCMTHERLPFTRPDIDEATIAAVAEVLRSGWLASGPKVKSFEPELSVYLGGRPVRVLTSSDRGAARSRSLAAGIGPGDEVITPAP